MNHLTTGIQLNTDEFQQSIDKLLREDEPQVEKQAAQQKVLSALSDIPQLWYDYEYESFPTHLFRVCTAKVVMPEEEHLIASFAYPTADKCFLGRANLPGYPVLYQSENTETAMREVECQPREIIYLSEWVLSNPQGARLGIFLHPQIDKGHAWFRWMAKYMRRLDDDAHRLEGFNGYTREKDKLFQLFCQVFRDDDYTLSSTIAHYLLYQQLADILVYPSQAQDHEHCNLAIATSFADQHMRMTRVFKLKKGEEGADPTEILGIGDVENGRVNWKI